MTDLKPHRWSLGAIHLTPRAGLFLVFAAHLLVIIIQSHDAWRHFWARIIPGAWRWSASFAPVGIYLAQAALIATVAVFGGDHWILRIQRVVLLIVWLALAPIAGSWLFAENRDAMLFEQNLIFAGFDVLLFSLPLALCWLLTGRRFHLPNEIAAPRFQFRLAQLVLLTFEVAILLALVRAMVAYNVHWMAEVWDNVKRLNDYIDWGLTVGAVIAITPAVIISAWPGRWWPRLLLLAGYEIVVSTITSLLQACGLPLLPQIWGDVLSASDLFWETLQDSIVFTFSAAVTICLTLAAVRLLGYEFFPFDRRDGGRHSSDATSAA